MRQSVLVAPSRAFGAKLATSVSDNSRDAGSVSVRVSDRNGGCGVVIRQRTRPR